MSKLKRGLLGCISMGIVAGITYMITQMWDMMLLATVFTLILLPPDFDPAILLKDR